MTMPTLPLAKGLGKDFRNADYVDLLPVNMLATPKEVLNAAGYLRSFPGIAKKADVAGLSRGAEYNTVQNVVYRVAGGKLYKGTNEQGSVSGSSRVSMAHSATSQAVAANGVMTLYRYDGTVKTLENWPETVGDVSFAQYEIGSVRDICRARGRYVWVKDGTQTFGVTDLEDESHPDRFRPFYSAESQPDGIIGCGVWRDFVVMFGSSTIEYFSLTGAADSTSAIYVSQPSLMLQKGIAGTYCKTEFADTFAFISHQSTGAPSIYLINSGQATTIATSTVEKVLREYTADELASGVLETVRFDSHELLIVHLPRHVLCYDAAASQNGPQWCILKTGLFNDVHRAIDYMFEGNQITTGDKTEPVLGTLQFDSSAQYDKQAEHLLFTPMFKANNSRVFDFELEAATGVSQYAERLFISATADGSNYGREQMIDANAPFVYDKRVLWRRIGRVRKNIGFKVRVITRSPVTLSDCSVRIE
ncbi:packaged DNA stabilization protein [Klebsiella aerogenes]